MSKFDKMKSQIVDSFNQMFLNVIKFALNSKTSVDRIEKLKLKYKGLPKDALAEILIKRAVRTNTIHGSANGAFITGAEAVATLPIPEPASKAVAISGTAAAIVEDATFSTKIQMQLILDLSELYDCVYELDDEEDVWLIFKAAMGVKGNDKAVKYVGYVFYETAKKQFRALLRTGIRSAIQKFIIKVAGQQVGKLLAEKYVLKLIPVATIVLSGVISSATTKYVGKWAKTKVKIRSALVQQIEKLKNEDVKYLKFVLFILYFVGTCDDKLTDNILSVYSNARKHLKLDDEELDEIEKQIDDDEFENKFFEALKEVDNERVKKILLHISITAAAVNFNPNENYQKCLNTISKVLGLEYRNEDLIDKINFFKK